MFALTRALGARAAHETYTLSIVYLVLTACFLGAFVPWWAAILLAPFAIQIPMCVMGLFVLPRWSVHLTANSRVLMALAIGASLWLRTWPSYAFLALVAANAIAATTMRRFLLGFAAAAPLFAIAFWPAGLGVVVLSHLLIVYATLVPNCQWLGPVITSFETDRNEVWLTIDDGPAPDTDAIKELLARRNAPATFFEIGVNHSKTHPAGTFWCLGPRRLSEEIGDARWFRAPVGMKNPFVHPILAKRGMRLIGWTVRGFDALGGDVERIVRRIVRGVRPGAIVVLHQGRPHSLRCIERVAEELQARGYEFVIPDDARLKTKR
jgi:peptidoglycan-N-acetylglucosamine deacetylase